MFYLVFSKDDKDKMLSKGAVFLKEENGAFLFKVNCANFESKDVKCIKTNDLSF